MKIVSTNVYVGPNLFARFPVIRHVIDLGDLEDWPTARLGDGFIDARFGRCTHMRLGVDDARYRLDGYAGEFSNIEYGGV